MRNDDHLSPKPPRLTRAEKCERALTLRKAGASFIEIAQQLGFRNAAAAGQAVSDALLNTVR